MIIHTDLSRYGPIWNPDLFYPLKPTPWQAFSISRLPIVSREMDLIYTAC